MRRQPPHLKPAALLPSRAALDTPVCGAQRVIGNYYIRKAQDHAKRGIKKVDLHTS